MLVVASLLYPIFFAEHAMLLVLLSFSCCVQGKWQPVLCKTREMPVAVNFQHIFPEMFSYGDPLAADMACAEDDQVMEGMAAGLAGADNDAEIEVSFACPRPVFQSNVCNCS